MQKHIVITVFGSLGDLHPMIALALGLQTRGHRVTIAASPMYQEKIEREAIGYFSLGPKEEYEADTYDKLFDRVRGPETLIKKYILPQVRDNFESLKPLLETADFLVNAPTVYAGPLLAELLKMPWASAVLQPFTYMSANDPPVLPSIYMAEHWRFLGPRFWKPFLSFLKSTCRDWPQEIYRLRRELNLPDRGNPIFEGQNSPYLNLGLFSQQIAKPQTDWPPNTQVTGFVFYDRMKTGETNLSPAIQKFLDNGAPPVVFTLGSSVVRTTTSFYEVSLNLVRELGCRAVFLADQHQPKQSLNDNILWLDAVAHSLLFPHAAAVVHQGGIGTTAQVLRAGKPMLMVPHGYDQPDNAARLKRLGVSRTIYPEKYQFNRVRPELSAILTQPDYRTKAEQIAESLRREDGLTNACNAIEAFLT